MINEFDRDRRKLQEKYGRLHSFTAATALSSLGLLAFMPALAPMIGTASVSALASKYGFDKFNEMAELESLSRSMTGVLCSAKSSGETEDEQADEE